MASSLSNVINYCRVINGSKGFNDTKTQLLSEMAQDYNEGREDAIYRFNVIVNTTDGKDIYVNDSTTPIRGVVDISRNQTADTEMEEKLQVYPNQIKQGDYIKFKVNDTDNLRTYLIKSRIEKKHGYDEVVFEECNSILKWMDDTGLHEQPCIIYNNTKYTGGTKSSNSITEIDAMVNITIQANKNTNKVNYGKRLFTMKNAWRVTLIDNITIENVFSWTLGKDSINSENDNVILEVCDYYEHSYTITLDSMSQSLVETSTYQIKSTVKDEGKIVLNPNVTYKSSDETIATVSEKGLVSALKSGSCVITCSIGSVSTTLNLTITAKTSIPVISYTCDWSTGKTSNGASLKTYMSSIATCEKMISGVKDGSLLVNYTLDSIGISLLNAKSISITRQSDVSFLVKNINVNTSKSFTISFTDSSDNSVINTSTVNLTKGI